MMNIRRVLPRPSNQLRIVYLRCALGMIEAYSSEYGVHMANLCRSCEAAIRTRHHEAIVALKRHPDSGLPDIYQLSFDTVTVYYTIALDEAEIRGFAWELDREPVDHWDGGGFCH